MEEEWKTVKYYPRYKVSTLGRIIRKETVSKGRHYNEKLLQAGEHNYSYQVALTNAKGRKMIRIGVIVATTFLEKKNEDDVLIHLDNNASNNELTNLKWGSRQEVYRVLKKPINATNVHTNEVISFPSINSCARFLGLDQPHITMCLSGRQKTHKGYKFSYIEEADRFKSELPLKAIKSEIFSYVNGDVNISKDRPNGIGYEYVDPNEVTDKIMEIIEREVKK